MTNALRHYGTTAPRLRFTLGNAYVKETLLVFYVVCTISSLQLFHEEFPNYSLAPHSTLNTSMIYLKSEVTNVISYIWRKCAILNHSNKNNYITSVFHWNVTIWLVMKWSHDYKRDVLHPNKTQTQTCTCLHDDVRCKQTMAYYFPTANNYII